MRFPAKTISHDAVNATFDCSDSTGYGQTNLKTAFVTQRFTACEQQIYFVKVLRYMRVKLHKIARPRFTQACCVFDRASAAMIRLHILSVCPVLMRTK